MRLHVGSERAIYATAFEDGRRAALQEVQSQVNDATTVQVAERLLKIEAQTLDTAATAVQRAKTEAYRAPFRDLACKDERDACLQCYRANAADTLRCASVVDALESCANRARDRLLRPGDRS